MLRVSGNAAAVEAAFGVHLSHARFADGFESLVADRALTLSPALAASGARTPQFSTAAPLHKDSQIIGKLPDNNQSTVGPYLTPDLRQAYDFPSAEAITAQGVTIGILMSGGFNSSDIATYLQDAGIPESLWGTGSTVAINGGLPYSTKNSEKLNSTSSNRLACPWVRISGSIIFLTWPLRPSFSA